MQQHVYKDSTKRIISQTFFIWMFVALQISTNIFLIPGFIKSGQYWAIAFINVILSAISIPSLYIFFNYYRYSANKDFIIAYNALKIIDKKNGAVVEISSTDIDRIELHQNLYPYKVLMNLSVWSDHEFFCFVDKTGKKIVVTSYIMYIQDFWLDSLTRRVSSDKLIKFEKFIPLIKDY